MNLKLTALVRLANQLAVRICLSIILVLELEIGTTALGFHVGDGDLNSGPHTCWELPYPLNHLSVWEATSGKMNAAVENSEVAPGRGMSKRKQ